MIRTDEEYMALALDLAREAAEAGEVPVGCVIVRDGEVIAEGRNRREGDRHALAHAEIEAIDGACRALGGWRLTGCTLYVTLEPCPMCAGAIVNARVPRVVYGTKDARAGAMGSVLHVNSYPLNHKAEVTAGVCADACAEILRGFFKSRREK
ncbi:MAG: tRNA adenosine(34) deaminase TadA [Clostridia bacterium]|nr:tRNA adenosine(34) deaminase TadA [Clostridia bacterium]